MVGWEYKRAVYNICIYAVHITLIHFFFLPSKYQNEEALVAQASYKDAIMSPRRQNDIAVRAA